MRRYYKQKNAREAKKRAGRRPCKDLSSGRRSPIDKREPLDVVIYTRHQHHPQLDFSHCWV